MDTASIDFTPLPSGLAARAAPRNMPGNMPGIAREAAACGSRVVVVAYDGLRVLEYAAAAEIFGAPRREMGGEWYEFAAAGIDAGPVLGGGGLRIETDGGLELLADADTVIMPGWPSEDAPVPEALCAALRAAHARGARIVSFCLGSFPLAAAGLLDGRRCTTHWSAAKALAHRHPAIRLVPDALYVEDGTVFTAGGNGAGLELGLRLARRDWGAKAANRVARRLLLPPYRQDARLDGRADGRPEGAARGPGRPPAAERGASLDALLDRVRKNLREDWSVDRMAAHMGVSARSLHRLFHEATEMTPIDWLGGERTARAGKLLETTDMPVDAIARTVGFASPSMLRHQFRFRFGTSPTAYRASFLPQPAVRKGAAPKVPMKSMTRGAAKAGR